MNCQQTQELMSAYLDAELDAADVRRVQSHLEGCEDCREALMRLETLQSRVAGQATVYQAPPHLRHRIQVALAAQRAPAPVAPKPRGRFAAWPWAWINLGVATAASAAFAVTLSLYMSKPSSSDVLEQELVASQIRALMPNHLEDVASTDQHTVKPWFAGKLDFSPPVHDLADEGFPLLGGRLDYLQQRPVAALVYGHRKHIINVYVWPSAPIHSQQSEHQGYNVVRWSQEGMSFSAVSDLNSQELADFSQRLRARAQ